MARTASVMSEASWVAREEESLVAREVWATAMRVLRSRSGVTLKVSRNCGAGYNGCEWS